VRRRGSANLILQLFLGLMVAALGWLFATYMYEWLVDRMTPSLEAALNVTLPSEYHETATLIHQILYYYPYLMLLAIVFSIIGIALRYSTRPVPRYYA